MMACWSCSASESAFSAALISRNIVRPCGNQPFVPDVNQGGIEQEPAAFSGFMPEYYFKIAHLAVPLQCGQPLQPDGGVVIEITGARGLQFFERFPRFSLMRPPANRNSPSAVTNNRVEGLDSSKVLVNRSRSASSAVRAATFDSRLRVASSRVVRIFSCAETSCASFRHRGAYPDRSFQLQVADLATRVEPAPGSSPQCVPRPPRRWPGTPQC